MKLENLTKGERFLIDNQYGLAGGFSSSLYNCICSADIYNLEKLRKGFPEEVEAFLRFSRELGYWESLQKKAEIK